MNSALIPLDEGQKIEGLQIPVEFYWVLRQPAPLAGMRLPSPSSKSWNELWEHGFRWVVCLCSDRPLYDPSPLNQLVTVELTDLAEESMPEDPELEENAIGIIAKKIVEKLDAGEGVIVHCAGGRGRTGTVLGVTLRLLGFDTPGVVEFLDQIHRVRRRPGWPEAEWQQKVVERAA